MNEVRQRTNSVLIVDDAAATRRRLASLFAELPQVEPFSCPVDQAQVLRAFRELQPQCVVIDVPAHGRHGFELIAALRRLHGSCLIVVLTNEQSGEMRRHSARAGADHILTKSKEFEHAVDLVRAFLEKV